MTPEAMAQAVVWFATGRVAACIKLARAYPNSPTAMQRVREAWEWRRACQRRAKAWN